MHRLIIYDIHIPRTTPKKQQKPLTDRQLQTLINELAIGTTLLSLKRSEKFPTWQTEQMAAKAGIKREVALRRKDAWDFCKTQTIDLDQLIIDMAMNMSLSAIAKKHHRDFSSIKRIYNMAVTQKRVQRLRKAILKHLWVELV